MGYRSVVLLCLVGFLAFASAQDGSYTFNFTFTDVVQYGINRQNLTSVLRNPFDFTLSARGNPVVSDLSDNSVFTFFTPDDRNFTKVFQNQGRIVDITSTTDAYLALIINNVTNSRTDLFLTRNFQSFAQINDASLGLQGLGVVYHTPSDTVYISDFRNRTISAYSLREFNFLHLIGDTTRLGASFANPSNASLNGPFRMATDPAGLWVADQNNNRVLHFPYNSTIADVVLGQATFTTNASGDPYDPTVLNRPYAIAYDQANRALYVSDSSGRILKFTSPFSNGQAAAAVLDATDAQAQNLYTLKSANLPDGSTRLFYLDNRRQKVTSGVVVIAPTPSITPSLSVSNSISLTNSLSRSPLPVPLSSGASQSNSGSLSVSQGALPSGASQSRSGSLSQSQGDTPVASPTSSVAGSISTTSSLVPLSSGASQSNSGSLSQSQGASPLASPLASVSGSGAPASLSAGASQSNSGSLSQSQGASPLASVSGSGAPTSLSAGASQSNSGSLSQSQGASPLASVSGSGAPASLSAGASQSNSGSLSQSQGASSLASVAASLSGSPASQSNSGSLSFTSAASLSASPVTQSNSASLSFTSAPSLSASPVTQSRSASLSFTSAPSLSPSPVTQSNSGSLSQSQAASPLASVSASGAPASMSAVASQSNSGSLSQSQVASPLASVSASGAPASMSSVASQSNSGSLSVSSAPRRRNFRMI